jgi:hypothetical protein
MTKLEIRKLWVKRTSEYKASGMGVSEWCKISNVKKSQVWYWLKKFRDEKTTDKTKTQWMEANVENIKPTNNKENIVVIKIGPASIQIKPGFDKSLLEDVIKVMTKIC